MMSISIWWLRKLSTFRILPCFTEPSSIIFCSRKFIDNRVSEKCDNYYSFTKLHFFHISCIIYNREKGASGRKDYRHRNILIHKRDILLSYERGGGHIGTWVWDERNQVRGISYARRGKRLRRKRQCFAGTFASTCKRLRQRMQTFEAKDANV